jgi:epoxyqueuosine reductase
MNAELKAMAERLGIDYFGVADLSGVKDEILDRGGKALAAYPYAISLGIALNNAIVDGIADRSDRGAAVTYRSQAYDVINMRLDLAASEIAGHIRRQGHPVLPIPAAETADEERICAVFSHKMGARLAGLGWIGKSCLLVTEKNGPRVRFTSILTAAPVTPTGEPMKEKCKKCTKCVDICPAQAFTGRNFQEDEPREMRYDAKKCKMFFYSMKQEGRVPVCGLCLYACPHGKKEKF